MKFERKKREVWKRRGDAVTSSGEEDGSFRVELEKEKGEGEMCQPCFFPNRVIFSIFLLRDFSRNFLKGREDTFS